MSPNPCPRCGTDVTMPHVFCGLACREFAVRTVVASRPKVAADPNSTLRAEVERLGSAVDLAAFRQEPF